MQAPDSPRQLVCQRLLSERVRLGLSRRAVVNSLDVAFETLRRWESTTPIPADYLAQLITMGYDVGFIVTGKVDSSTPPDQHNELLALLRSMAETERSAIEQIIRAVARV